MYCHDKEFNLTIVRHGQTEANVLRTIQGHSNTPLTKLGLEQALALANYFKNQQHLLLDRLYSSDLDRAYQTCRIIAQNCAFKQVVSGRDKDLIIQDVRLRERAYGPNYEGRPIARLQDDAHKFGFNRSNFTQFTPDGVESMEEVKQRVSDFCTNTLWPECLPGEEVLIVSHWATIKEFLKLFQPLANGAIRREDLLETPNTAFNRFRIGCRKQESGGPMKGNYMEPSDDYEKTDKFELSAV